MLRISKEINMIIQKRSVNLFIVCYFLFNTNIAYAAGLPLYSTELTWENVSANTGIKRYRFDDKPNLPHNAKIIDNHAYWFFGNGYNQGSSSQNSILSMNLISGELSESKSIGKNYLSGNATISYQGRLFSVGGKGNFITHSLNNLVEFDPSSGEWQQKNASLLSRHGSQAEVYNNKVYVFGGYGFDTFNEGRVKIDGEGFFYTDADENATWRQEIQVYDIASQEWSIVGIAPDLPILWDSTIIGDDVYFSAEKDWISSSQIINRYNIANQTWDSINLPESLVSKKIIAVGHLLVVYGTLNYALDPNSSWQTYIYDTQQQRWFSGVPLPNPDQTFQVFSLASDQNNLYLFEHSNGRLDTDVKNTYQLHFNISVGSNDNFIAIEEQTIETLKLDNGEQLGINENGDVVNLVINNQSDYDLILQGDGSTEQKSALKRLTHSVYQTLGDDFQFIYFIFNEPQRVFPHSPYGYHSPVKNNIQGIGQGIFDFTKDYGSEGNLESVVVLSTQLDLIYGPSLHETAHRWGNYLKTPLHSLRHKEWLRWQDKDAYHWGYLSSSGQLGGWRDDFFAGDLSHATDNSYLLTDGPEGGVGFSGIGPGNNFAKYSDLELYLMGLISSENVADLIEPKTKPIETAIYPIHIIEEFNTISMADIIATNGHRIPANTEARKSMSALFVVVSKENITQSDWNNYSHQVNNFTRNGQDDYTRLNNFWEATQGKASLDVPNILQYIQDSDNDDVLDINDDFPNNSAASVDTDFDTLPDNFNQNCSETCVAGSGLILDDDDDDDGFEDQIETDAGTDPLDKNDYPVAKSTVHGDHDGDGKADMLWRNNVYGNNVLWTMNGLSITHNAGINTVANQAWQIFGRGDFDGDGKSDLLWRNIQSGENVIYLMDGANIVSTQALNVVNLSWDIKAVGDFNGDGKDDIFWRNTRGNTAIYLMNSNEIVSSANITRVANMNWEFVDTGDVNGDGKDDLVWRHKLDGINVVWLMDGLTLINDYQLNTISVNWLLVGLGDLNGDGISDFIWRNQLDGRNHAYLMNEAGQIQSSQSINVVPNLGWQIADILDLNGDGKDDLFWRDVTGRASIYLMNGVEIQKGGASNNIPDVWQNIR
jgi:hypothetical protein